MKRALPVNRSGDGWTEVKARKEPAAAATERPAHKKKPKLSAEQAEAERRRQARAAKRRETLQAEQRDPLWATFGSLPPRMVQLECEPLPLPARAPRGAVADYAAVYSCHGRVCRGKGIRPEFSTLAELINHVANVEHVELAECVECGAEICASRLGEHMKTEHQRPAHYCATCNLHTASPAQHRWHCHCGQAAATLKALEAHARNQGHAVVACYACGQGFATAAAMHQHKSTAHK